MKKTTEEINAMKIKYAGIPDHCLPLTRKKKTPANELAFQIIQHVKSVGGQCYRINSQGQFDPRTKTWRKSGMKKGLSDLQAIVLGRFIAIEVKIGRDRQSEEQKKREAEIKQAGAFYIIAKDIEQFKKDLHTIIDQIK